MDDEGEAVERYVRQGLLLPLNRDTYETELAALREDLLNWDHGHDPVSVLEEMYRS